MIRPWWLQRYDSLPVAPECIVQSWDTAIKSAAHAVKPGGKLTGIEIGDAILREQDQIGLHGKYAARLWSSEGYQIRFSGRW